MEELNVDCYKHRVEFPTGVGLQTSPSSLTEKTVTTITQAFSVLV